MDKFQIITAGLGSVFGLVIFCLAFWGVVKCQLSRDFDRLDYEIDKGLNEWRTSTLSKRGN